MCCALMHGIASAEFSPHYFPQKYTTNDIYMCGALLPYLSFVEVEEALFTKNKRNKRKH